ncbi:S100 calcium binding protein U [Sebastes fasciatus]|uniref:S100 calcium binding protein U n=1 Tax=Sebastes fasciatus TaxID=394691 RepID=UPI003D9EF880
MESAVQTMVKVFLKSTKGKESLGKSQFQSLVKNQLSNVLSDTDSKEAVNNMGQGLDANQDGKVGFEEYLKLVGYLATSLSEQRNLAKEEPAQNAASGQVAQSTPDKVEEVKPEANNAEAKAEAKPEANEGPKVEAVAGGIKVEENVMKVDIKSGGETLLDVAKEEVKPAAAGAAEAAAAAVVAAGSVAAGSVVAAGSEVVAAAEEAVAPVEVVVKEVGDETEECVEAAENLAAGLQEDVEKKIEEATS